MAQSNALTADIASPGPEAASPGSDSGVRLRSTVHPLLAAIESAPLAPISDEENAEFDNIVRTTTKWLTDEEFVAAAGLPQIA
ncbi:MAG: hypothetical protein IPM54_31295 [Polyangiaceae bacterium]|nr:hypothetical protein [Polyangiaceae bacterium]